MSTLLPLSTVGFRCMLPVSTVASCMLFSVRYALLVSYTLTVNTVDVHLVPPVSTAGVSYVLTVKTVHIDITPPVSTAGVSYILTVSTVYIDITPPVSTAGVSVY